MKVVVNRKRCEGFGSCQQAAPEIYQLDDDGNLFVSHDGEDVPPEHEAATRRGARACPVAALLISDNGQVIA